MKNINYPLLGSRGLITIAFLFVSVIAFSQYQQINIGGATLHYKEAGSGHPVIFIHGNAEDMRNYERQLNDFSKNYRTIIYSRRFNYPNKNNPEVTNFS